MSSFQAWWDNEGSAMRPLPNEDTEEFAKRVTQIAWSNGEYVEREACAKVCEAQRDLREEARAALRVADALKEGDEDTMLRALRHESDVRLYHAGIDKCAASIRARGMT